ncbi:hypothetical protein ABBQ32_002341 [Trebouxia sp. C0010 RCD-2024]
MISLLGYPVSLPYRQAGTGCNCKAKHSATAIGSFGNRLLVAWPRKACSSLPSTSRTCGQQQKMSDSLTSARGTQAEPKPSGRDLLVVGPGVLGSYVGILWQQQYPSATVVGQTNSTANHDRLQQMHIQPRTKDGADSRKFPYVLFSAPPSGSTDYPAEVREAAKLWDGTGSLVFTSSAGLYEVEDGSHCNEDCKIADRGSSERTDKLRGAEDAVLEAGGIAIRLVGLYHAHRGAHTFFLRQGQVSRWGGYTVNLIHYEDAARLCVAALQSSSECRGRVFVGADSAPITFEDMMEACHASGKFPGQVEFTGEETSKKGKIMSNCQTREALNWQPKYPSFEEFMAAGADDFYNTSPLYAAKPLGSAHAK